MTMTYKDHKHYERAKSAYNWLSFSPEKRAESECAYFDETVQKLNEAGKGEAIAKFEQLFLTYLHAKSRCASSMIAGPACFSVERMQKRNDCERKHAERMYDFVKKVMAPPKQPRTELDYKIEEKEYTVGDVTVLHNTEENRLQLLFPGKPDQEVISRLKSTGFKWSPRFKAWQRQLTHNALLALPFVLKQ